MKTDDPNFLPSLFDRIKNQHTDAAQNLDKIFDLKFWQSQPAKIRFLVAWELILQVYRQKGTDVGGLSIQRSIENYQRQPWIE